jgi:hypothetical protein
LIPALDKASCASLKVFFGPRSLIESVERFEFSDFEMRFLKFTLSNVSSFPSSAQSGISVP